jgi:hypothetical protein
MRKKIERERERESYPLVNPNSDRQTRGYRNSIKQINLSGRGIYFANEML